MGGGENPQSPRTTTRLIRVMPKPDKPLKTAFTPLRAKPVGLPPPPPKAPAPEPAQAAPFPPTPSLQAPQAPKPDKPLPAEVQLALELVERPDRCVAGWCYRDKSQPQQARLVLVANLAHDGLASALQAKDARALSRWCGLVLAEALMAGGFRPMLCALQAAFRQELLAPEQRQVRGWLFLGETIARHPTMRLAAEQLCAQPPPKARLPLGSVSLQSPPTTPTA